MCLGCRDIFEAARDRHAPLHLQACIFGGDDFAASIGATRSPSSRELLHARQSVVIHCRAYNVQPIDIVNVRMFVGLGPQRAKVGVKHRECDIELQVTGSRFQELHL